MSDLASTIIVLCGSCCCAGFFLLMAAWITVYVGKRGEINQRHAFARDRGLVYDEVSEHFYNHDGEEVL